ncbi:BGTF surface domain-containing protein [Halomontanus rarus]|uniref:DUF7827 domain-containing protein n=1 Tax=Halomontanus rarus TaxID=3034020 RepID=UPI0023E7E1CD|nr:BGTF surface domain-containing protein [Halovivax sp. TS33]
MTDNTTYREKGRALFLAALMVLSVFAMAAALPGSAVADHEEDNNELTQSELSGADVWVGQVLNITDYDASETVQLREGVPSDASESEGIRYVQADENGNVHIDTTDLNENPHFIRDSDGNDSDAFWVEAQDLSVDFSSEETPANEKVDLEYDSARDESDLVISGELDGEALDAETLEEIFNASQHNDNDEILVENVSDSVEANFNGQDVGDYEFAVDVHDSTASDNASVTVTQATDLEVTFDSDSYTEEVGDVVDVTVQLEGTDTATINFAEEDGYYDANVTVTSNEDEVNLSFNTYEAGQGDDISTDGGDVFSVDEDAEITHAEEDAAWSAGDRMLPSDFELLAYSGEEATGDESGVAFLSLQDRSTGDEIGTYVYPGSLGDDVDLEDVLNDSTQRDSVAERDSLVFEIEASGIYGYLFDENGDWSGETEGVNLTFSDTDAPRYGDGDEFTLDEISSDNVDIFEDADNDHFYVVVDVTSVEAGSTNATMDAEETWNAEFEVSDDNPYVADDETESVSQDFNIEERSIELVGEYDDDDRFQVASGDDTSIDAETNIAPGGDVNYRLRIGTDILTEDTTIGADGTISASFDLSDHEVGDVIDNIRVREQAHTGADRGVVSTEGIIVEGDDDGEGDKEEVTLKVDNPGEIMVGEDAEFDATVTNNKDEEVTTTLTFEFDGESKESELTIDAESSASETFTVSDLDAGDYSWSVSDSDFELSEEGTLTVAGDGEDNKTEDNSTEDDSTETEDDSTEDDSNDSDDEDDSSSDDDGQPGFGVAVAIVALLAAAMLALRRQN